MKARRLAKPPAVLGAVRAARELESHDGWSPGQVAALQRQRLLAAVRDAAARSPFYRESFAGIELSDDLDPAALPTLDKPTMLATSTTSSPTPASPWPRSRSTWASSSATATPGPCWAST